jgi:hypothetical protein
MFGYGILTFIIPYLFTTPPGYNLLARGPANEPKDGIAPLEGVIETDWAVATFTMNWQFTRPDRTVAFESGEPVCMVVPQRRGELESFEPVITSLRDDPGLTNEHAQWAKSRRTFLAQRRLASLTRGGENDGPHWQKHYFHGTTPSGLHAPIHQRRLSLLPFRPEGADGPRARSRPGARDDRHPGLNDVADIAGGDGYSGKTLK